MQIKIMNQLLDAWEEQIKLPNPMGASPTAILSNCNLCQALLRPVRQIPATLDAARGTVAANLDRCDGRYDQAPLRRENWSRGSRVGLGSNRVPRRWQQVARKWMRETPGAARARDAGIFRPCPRELALPIALGVPC
jgi:hypothetical protein